MNNKHNDVKSMVALSSVFWSHNHTDFPIQVYRCLIPMLVNGTKERNTGVRINSEQALKSLLKLYSGNDATFKAALEVLDSGAANALRETVSKFRGNHLVIVKEDEIDDTFLQCPV